MNNKEFEAVFIMKPDLQKSEQTNLKSIIISEIDKYAKVKKFQDLGIRKLAYQAKKYKMGWYLAVEFETTEQKNFKCDNEIAKKIRTIPATIRVITSSREYI